MRRFAFVGVGLLSIFGFPGAASAADMSAYGKAPAAVPMTYDWTGCYVGGHVGGVVSQDRTTGVLGNSTGFSSIGFVGGGQIGCDYQFAPSWVVGIEGSAAGSTMKGSTVVGLPNSVPDTALVQAKTDFLTSVTARVGLAFDNVLLYAKGGAAMAGDRYDVTGSIGGTQFGFVGLENRIGWTAGGGLEWAFSQHWSTNIEYDYYGFGHRAPVMNDQTNGVSGIVDVRQSIQVVKVGLNFHMWGSGF